MDANKIGNFILELRKEKGWSQNDLANKIPISRQAISKWERGVSVPDSATLIILSNLFDVSIDEIILGRKIYKSKNRDKTKLEELISTVLKTSDDNIKKDKINKKLKISLFIAIFLSVNLFLVYYFINSYKSIKLFIVSGEGDNFSVYNSIFVTTRDKVYFKLSDIKAPKNEEIQEIELYYYDNNDKYIVFRSNGNDEILLRDYYGLNFYFDLDKLNLIKNNLYLKICTDSLEEELKLKVEEDFTNDKLIFRKYSNGVIEESNTNKKENDIENIIEKNMDCDAEICNLNVTDKRVEFVYFKSAKQLIIADKSSDNNTEWIYTLDAKMLDYRKYDNNVEIELININLNKASTQDEKYIKEFNEKYLKKYFNVSI